jgi:hypothetical protein
MHEIDSMSWSNPQVHEGDLTVPLVVNTGHRKSQKYYLTEEKLEALQWGSEDALENLKSVVEQ